MNDTEALSPGAFSSLPEEVVEREDEQAKKEAVIASIVDHPGWGYVRELLLEKIEWWKHAPVDASMDLAKIGERVLIANNVAAELTSVLLDIEEKHRERSRRNA